MLTHLLDCVGALSSTNATVAIHARRANHRELRELVDPPSRDRVILLDCDPPVDAAVLRTDRFYDKAWLRRCLGRGQSPEGAVLWRLDRSEALLTADEELTRRLTYQPIGKYWAFPLAWRLADRLCGTRVRPNAVTLGSAILMVTAAGLVAAGTASWVGRATVALAMALALVLDTADGRLARLQGTSSAFGRWLDQFLDELADLALHAAIAWAAYSRTGMPLWLLIGIIYASGKYLYLVQSLLADELEGRSGRTRVIPASVFLAGSRNVGADRIARLLRLVGHADIRWHFWIMLAALGRLEVALAVYAAYFPGRALAAAVRKGVRYA
jgi:phosphatidylglycerophosphate synthase